jgi:hypothetical protein
MILTRLRSTKQQDQKMQIYLSSRWYTRFSIQIYTDATSSIILPTKLSSVTGAL